MAERIPRRLRRFKRSGEMPLEEDTDFLDSGYSQKEGSLDKKADKEITMRLALDEVKRFKEEHKRLPKKEEYDRIAESIYAQLKDEEQRKKAVERLERKTGKRLLPSERAKSRRKRERPSDKEYLEDKKKSAFADMQEAARGIERPGIDRPGIKEAGIDETKPNKEIGGLEVEDLFGEKKQKEESLGKGAEEAFSLGNLEDFEGGLKEDQQQKCPKCHNPTDEVIFCPECGAAFCENCAKKVERMGKSRTIVCPECKFKIKK